MKVNVKYLFQNLMENENWIGLKQKLMHKRIKKNIYNSAVKSITSY